MIYKTLISEINRLIKIGNYCKALETIDTFALVAEKINDIFRSDILEDTLRYIGENVIGKVTIPSSNHFPKRIVFYDQVGTTICLALQYLRALKSLGYEVFYIFERNSFLIDNQLKKEVEEICVKTAYYEGNYSLSTAKNIQKSIVEFGAPKLIAQSPCFGAMGCSIFYSLMGIEKFRIVPGDQHFYIGIDCMDHFLEYRDFGINVAVHRRNIPINKIHYLPYYPIIESNIPFQGFPESVKGKLVIGAAAREEKFHGSNWFFDASKYILEKYDNVVILFIGGKSEKVLSFVEKNSLQNRFFVLGYRQDFVECMKHIDIFFDSYPWGSALTSMTAAYFSKPIISYHDKKYSLESLNGWLKRKDGKSISYSDENQLYNYIERIIKDEQFRNEEGGFVRQSLPSASSFVTGLQTILEKKVSVREYTPLNLEVLNDRSSMYLDLQREFSPLIIGRLFQRFHRFRFFRFFPFLWKEGVTFLYGNFVNSKFK